MQIPKEIREKIEERNRLNEELKSWFDENTDTEGCNIRDAYIVDEPTGESQGDGEYCEQWIMGEDWYRGHYYWQMDNGKYLCMDYEI